VRGEVNQARRQSRAVEAGLGQRIQQVERDLARERGGHARTRDQLAQLQEELRLIHASLRWRSTLAGLPFAHGF